VRHVRGALTRTWLAAALATSCGGSTRADEPFLRLEVPLERATLKNGLELYVVPNHEAPVVTAVMGVRAGAFLEDATDNGYSHLFEHIIFDGSEDVPDPVDFRNRVEALGASSNGTTSVDEVVYYFTAGSASLGDATSLFAGALERPALVPEQLEREKKVVLGEFDLDESDDDFLRHRRMLQELYGDYVTRVEPLGSREVVMNTTSDQLHAAHDAYYVPNNAMLVLSGDVEMQGARSIAEKAFGDWAPGDGAALKKRPPKPAPLQGSRYAVLEAPISDTRIAIGFMCQGAQDDTAGALAGNLLSKVTYQTDHPFRTLVGRYLATSAAFDVSAYRYTTYATVEIVVPHGAELQVLRTARDVLDHLGEPGDVTSAQLSTAKHELFGDYFYSSADPGSVAHSVAAYWASWSVDRFVSYPDDVYAVGLDGLDRFAAGCVRGRPRVVVLQSSADNLERQSLDEAFLRELL
jgi:zinc protease